MAENDINLPELSEMAWGILDLANGMPGRIHFDRCAPGPRDALIAAGALGKEPFGTPVPPSSKRKAAPQQYSLFITEKGRAMLAQRKG